MDERSKGRGCDESVGMIPFFDVLIVVHLTLRLRWCWCLRNHTVVHLKCPY